MSELEFTDSWALTSMNEPGLSEVKNIVGAWNPKKEPKERDVGLVGFQ